jgi:hypothetical protein
MYAHLLAIVARERVDAPEGLQCVEFARRCRVELASADLARDEPSVGLAAELRYDRALLALCASVGIETSASRFSPTITERRRLEQELTSRDIDLSVRGASRHRAADRGGVAPGGAASSSKEGGGGPRERGEQHLMST